MRSLIAVDALHHGVNGLLRAAYVLDNRKEGTGYHQRGAESIRARISPRLPRQPQWREEQ